jgi:hypothetical protein
MPATYQTVRLAPGRHARPDDGVCVMELASMLAHQPLTDHPSTVSPVVAALLRGYNDGLDAERRQSLKYYAAACLGTAGERPAERERRRELRHWLAAAAVPRGRLTRLGWCVRLLDLQSVGRALGFRVRERDDEDLHRRVLALVDRLVALGGTPAAPVAPAPARDAAVV